MVKPLGWAAVALTVVLLLLGMRSLAEHTRVRKAEEKTARLEKRLTHAEAMADRGYCKTMFGRWKPCKDGEPGARVILP